MILWSHLDIFSSIQTLMKIMIFDNDDQILQNHQIADSSISIRFLINYRFIVQKIEMRMKIGWNATSLGSHLSKKSEIQIQMLLIVSDNRIE